MVATAEETSTKKIPKIVYFKGRILAFYTKFYFKKSCVMFKQWSANVNKRCISINKRDSTDSFRALISFSKEVASLQILFLSSKTRRISAGCHGLGKSSRVDSHLLGGGNNRLTMRRRVIILVLH